MPWKHCGHDEIFDNLKCPTCGITKAQWTLEWNVTRTFSVASAPKASVVRVLLLDPNDNEVAGEAYDVILADGKTCQKSELDGFGTAKIDCPAGKAVQVGFPDLPDDAWELIPDSSGQASASTSKSGSRAACAPRSKAHRFRATKRSLRLLFGVEKATIAKGMAFRLFDADQSINLTKTLKDDKASEDDLVELVYVVPYGDRKYSLEVDPSGAGDAKYLAFQNVPEAELDDPGGPVVEEEQEDVVGVAPVPDKDDWDLDPAFDDPLFFDDDEYPEIDLDDSTDLWEAFSDSGDDGGVTGAQGGAL